MLGLPLDMSKVGWLFELRKIKVRIGLGVSLMS